MVLYSSCQTQRLYLWSFNRVCCISHQQTHCEPSQFQVNIISQSTDPPSGILHGSFPVALDTQEGLFLNNHPLVKVLNHAVLLSSMVMGVGELSATRSLGLYSSVSKDMADLRFQSVTRFNIELFSQPTSLSQLRSYFCAVFLCAPPLLSKCLAHAGGLRPVCSWVAFVRCTHTPTWRGFMRTICSSPVIHLLASNVDVQGSSRLGKNRTPANAR